MKYIYLSLFLFLSVLTQVSESVRYVHIVTLSSCDMTGEVYRITSVPENVCFDFAGGVSARATIGADGYLQYSYYAGGGCPPINPAFVSGRMNGTCGPTGNLKWQGSGIMRMFYSYEPQVPAPNYFFYQVASTCAANPNPETTMSSVIKPNVCIPAETFGNYDLKIWSTGTIQVLHNFGCGSVSYPWDGAQCGNIWSLDKIFSLKAGVPANTLNFNVSNVAITNYNGISANINTTGDWYQNIINYVVYYWSPNDTNWAFLSYINNPNIGTYQTDSIPDGISPVLLKFAIAGEDYTGQSNTLNYYSQPLIMPTRPKMVSVSTVFVGITYVTIKYNSTNGMYGKSTVFQVMVNGKPYTDASCSQDTNCSTISTTCTVSVGTCTISGLEGGSVAQISVLASNNDVNSDSISTTVQLYPAVTLSPWTYTTTSSSISIDFEASGGVPNSIKYIVKNGGIPVPSCNDINDNYCIIAGLYSLQNYNIEVTAYSLDSFSSIAQVIKVWDDISSVSITNPSKTTTTLTLNFTSTGGDPTKTKYYVYLNDVLYSDLHGITSNTYKATGLEANTDYRCRILGSNNGVGKSSTTTYTTYANVASPSVQFVSSDYYSILIQFNTTGGVPGATTYRITVDNNNFSGCNGISVNTCNITGLFLETLYTINIFALNDGYTSSGTIVKYSTSNLPKVTDLVVVDYTTKVVVFKYNTTDGVSGTPTTFNVKVDGTEITDTNCINGFQCTAEGIASGKNISVEVQAVNSGLSGPSSIVYFVSYSLVSSPTLTSYSASTKGINLAYSSTGGIPGQTVYNIQVNGSVYQQCSNGNGVCNIGGLNSGVTYRIELIATNDEYSATTTKDISTSKKINSLQIDATPRTTKIYLEYTVKDGYGPTYYYPSINGDEYSPCSDIDQEYCDVAELSANTEYNITVMAWNEDYEISASKIFKTYDIVSVPRIDSHQTSNDKKFTLLFESDNGVPGESVYNVSMNGVEVSGCTNISATSCVIPNTPLGTNVTFNVTVSNDGIVTSGEETIETFEYLTQSAIEIKNKNLTEITIGWEKSTGGKNGSTIYTASISEKGKDWVEKCSNTTNTECFFGDLKQNTQYNFKVVTSNPAFSDSLTSEASATTLKSEDGSDSINNSNHLVINLLLLCIASIVSLLI